MSKRFNAVNGEINSRCYKVCGVNRVIAGVFVTILYVAETSLSWGYANKLITGGVFTSYPSAKLCEGMSFSGNT